MTKLPRSWKVSDDRAFCARCLLISQLPPTAGGGIKMVLSGNQAAFSAEERMIFNDSSGPGYGWDALQNMLLVAQTIESHESQPRVYWYSAGGAPCGIWAVTMAGGTALCQYHLTIDWKANEPLRR